MNMSKEQYSEYIKQKSPNSKLWLDIFNAFWIGGLICCLGQGITNLYIYLGLNEKLAGTYCSITLVFLGALLTGLNVYGKIAKIAGAGTLVPITGFSNAIVSPAMEFKSEGHIMGIGAKMFIIAGPVLVYGISASIVLGFILWIFNLA